MLVILPPIVYGLIAANLLIRCPGRDPRPALLDAVVIWGVGLAVITEGLSLFHTLTYAALVSVWLAAAIIAAAFWWRAYQQGKRIALSIPIFEAFDVATSLGTGAILLITLITALLAPPNNWDSLVYHMARVPHWIQNQSVAHYPTHIIRQLYQPPWAEWVITHLQILSGGDRFANLVQWAAFGGGALGASLLAKHIGASRRGQMVTILFVAAIPMGILQASSTQNDLVVTFWLVCIAHYTLDAHTNGTTWSNALGYGASLGLAVLTKGTAYFFGLPFVVWYGWLLVKALRRTRQTVRRFFSHALAITLLIVGLNAGHLARNIQVFSTPFVESDLYANQIFGPVPLASNLIRNTLSHVYAPFAPFDRWLLDSVFTVHNWLGLSPDDPRTTFQDHPYDVRTLYTPGVGFTPKAFHEDTAANTLHLLLAFVAAVIIFLVPRLRANRRLITLFAALAGGALTYAVMVNYQPWASRLHMPLFVIFTPIAAHALARLRPQWPAWTAVMLLALGAVPFLLINYSRPVLPPGVRTLSHERTIYSPRADQLFTNHPTLQPAYQDVAAYIDDSTCLHIGLITLESWEYPLWAMVEDAPGLIRFQHVAVTNVSQTLAAGPRFSAFDPCLLVVIDRQTGPSVTLPGGATYHLVYNSDSLKTYTLP